jgi:hypothetical protein
MSIIMPGSEDTAKYGGQIINPSAPRNDLFSVQGSDVENPFNERHDIDATRDSIEKILADGTPNWVRWPKDYKAMAKEDFDFHREKSDKMGTEYRWADQAMLTDKKSRRVNGIQTRDFIEKLQKNGIKCAVFDNGWKSVTGVPTVALFCVPPNRTNKIRPICYLDVPMMFEWSVLHLDKHGIPSGEDTRGWRTVAVQLVEKDIITEAQCHRIFGAPSANKISGRYYRALWEKRNGKPYVDEEDREGFQE